MAVDNLNDNIAQPQGIGTLTGTRPVMPDAFFAPTRNLYVRPNIEAYRDVMKELDARYIANKSAYNEFEKQLIDTKVNDKDLPLKNAAIQKMKQTADDLAQTDSWEYAKTAVDNTIQTIKTDIPFITAAKKQAEFEKQDDFWQQQVGKKGGISQEQYIQGKNAVLNNYSGVKPIVDGSGKIIGYDSNLKMPDFHPYFDSQEYVKNFLKEAKADTRVGEYVKKGDKWVKEVISKSSDGMKDYVLSYEEVKESDLMNIGQQLLRSNSDFNNYYNQLQGWKGVDKTILPATIGNMRDNLKSIGYTDKQLNSGDDQIQQWWQKEYDIRNNVKPVAQLYSYGKETISNVEDSWEATMAKLQAQRAAKTASGSEAEYTNRMIMQQYGNLVKNPGQLPTVDKIDEYKSTIDGKVKAMKENAAQYQTLLEEDAKKPNTDPTKLSKESRRTYLNEISNLKTLAAIEENKKHEVEQAVAKVEKSIGVVPTADLEKEVLDNLNSNVDNVTKALDANYQEQMKTYNQELAAYNRGYRHTAPKQPLAPPTKEQLLANYPAYAKRIAKGEVGIFNKEILNVVGGRTDLAEMNTDNHKKNPNDILYRPYDDNETNIYGLSGSLMRKINSQVVLKNQKLQDAIETEQKAIEYQPAWSDISLDKDAKYGSVFANTYNHAYDSNKFGFIFIGENGQQLTYASNKENKNPEGVAYDENGKAVGRNIEFLGVTNQPVGALGYLLVAKQSNYDDKGNFKGSKTIYVSPPDELKDQMMNFAVAELQKGTLAGYTPGKQSEDKQGRLYQTNVDLIRHWSNTMIDNQLALFQNNPVVADGKSVTKEIVIPSRVVDGVVQEPTKAIVERKSPTYGGVSPIYNVTYTSSQGTTTTVAKKDITEVEDYLENIMQIELGAAAQYRTDRHNNPTAFTVDLAKQAGLIEGVDYTKGDYFSEGGYTGYTARLTKDPIATTIRLIDKLGFYKEDGKTPRWTHTSMSKTEWDALSYEEKKNTILKMYKNEAGSSLLPLFG